VDISQIVCCGRQCNEAYEVHSSNLWSTNMFSKVMGVLFVAVMAVACYFLATIHGPDRYFDAEGSPTALNLQTINSDAAKAAPDASDASEVHVAKVQHSSALIQAQD
jgi:hypothetical protein